MKFPFEFLKPSGAYDFISPLVNTAANAAIIGVGAAVLTAISFVALNALGFKIAALSVGVIAVSIAAVGVGITIAAFVGLELFADKIAKNFSRGF